MVQFGEARGRARAAVVAGLAALVLSAGLVAAAQLGACSQQGVAATYDGGYVSEQEVSDYIVSYRKQMGYEGTTDEAWTEFLESYKMTPEMLRLSVVKQKVIDAMVAKRADELGVTVDGDEMEEYIANIKDNLALGDDEIYRQTLEAQGQTVDEAEDGFYKLVLREKLLEREVETPEADDEQTGAYLKASYPEGVQTKHIYRFTKLGLDSDGSYDKLAAVQGMRKELVEGGVSKKEFAAFVKGNSDDAELVSRAGADGYDLDIADRGEKFQEAVDNTGEGEVSGVFADADGYSFVWIDSVYSVPVAPDGDSSYDLSALPDELLSYFRDCASRQLWQLRCQEYLEKLYADANVSIQ